jgi:hypothetical protein
MISLGVTDGENTIGLAVVTRSADSYDANGNGVKGAETDPVDIQGDVQPASGKMLQDLPEGMRDEIEYMIWTPFDVKNDHVIVYSGQRYRVFKTWPRREDGFTKAAIGVLKNDR